jgi:hypothetical protein
MMKTPFRCYVCAEAVTDRFVICAMSDDTDRGFVVCEKCVSVLEDCTHIVHVEAKKTSVMPRRR